MRELLFLVSGIMVFAAAAGSANAQESRGVAPRDIESWAWEIQQHYPVSALNAHEEGTVTVRLEIDETGRVRACTVTNSSQSVPLDEAACSGMKEFARYDPALDDNGEPRPAVTVQSIRYVLPDRTKRHTDPVPIDMEIWRAIVFDASFDEDLRKYGTEYMVFQLVIDEDGRPSGCGMNHSTGSAVFDRRGCEALLRHARFGPAALLDGTPIPGSYWISHAVTEVWRD